MAFDLLVAMWLVAPWMVYLGLRSTRRFAQRRDALLRRFAFAVLLAAVIFIAAAEIVFFGEFDGRFNFVAVDYLIYPTEVVTNIWESYPLAWLVAGIAGASIAGTRLLRPLFERADRDDHAPWSSRAAVLALYAMAVGGATFMMSPGLAHVGEDRVMNEVASSGYYTFWQALLGRDAAYEGWYPTRSRDTVERRLMALTDSVQALRAPRVSRRLNVVVVLEESFGSTFVSALHPRDSAALTPSFDSLAAEGTLFTRIYSTGNRTIRAIEATTASVPPLPGISIVRRPQSQHLFTLPAVLRANGYATEFVYGGREFFVGMGSYARSICFSKVLEQSDFPQ
jgi:phosphoglycerol transferase MdoB-like AlkP superfamily enzyme